MIVMAFPHVPAGAGRHPFTTTWVLLIAYTLLIMSSGGWPL